MSLAESCGVGAVVPEAAEEMAMATRNADPVNLWALHALVRSPG